MGGSHGLEAPAPDDLIRLNLVAAVGLKLYGNGLLVSKYEDVREALVGVAPAVDVHGEEPSPVVVLDPIKAPLLKRRLAH